MQYFPGPQKIKELLKQKDIGYLSFVNYYSRQNLVDWHPWESVNDFYVSKRITGEAKEIVPFELTWLTDVFGFPKEIKGFFSKTMYVVADIEDSYSFNMRFENGIGSVIVDVAARFATRSLIINMEKAQLRWNWEEGIIKLYEADRNRWINYLQPEGKVESGYNKNIIEEMYIEEIKSFIEGIKDSSKYPNSLENDLKVLSLLDAIENSDGGFNR